MCDTAPNCPYPEAHMISRMLDPDPHRYWLPYSHAVTPSDSDDVSLFLPLHSRPNASELLSRGFLSLSPWVTLQQNTSHSVVLVGPTCILLQLEMKVQGDFCHFERTQYAYTSKQHRQSLHSIRWRGSWPPGKIDTICAFMYRQLACQSEYQHTDRYSGHRGRQSQTNTCSYFTICWHALRGHRGRQSQTNTCSLSQHCAQ